MPRSRSARSHSRGQAPLAGVRRKTQCSGYRAPKKDRRPLMCLGKPASPLKRGSAHKAPSARLYPLRRMLSGCHRVKAQSHKAGNWFRVEAIVMSASAQTPPPADRDEIPKRCLRPARSRAPQSRAEPASVPSALFFVLPAPFLQSIPVGFSHPALTGSALPGSSPSSAGQCVRRQEESGG